MSPARLTLFTGLGMATLAILFVWAIPLPRPFPGATWAVGSVVAFLGTLSLIAWMPPRWLWSDGEILTHAFRAHHGMTEQSAARALDAILAAHGHADGLRRKQPAFRDDLAEVVGRAADRLDGAAREIFYQPERLAALRTILLRTPLIDEATAAHHAMVKRGARETEATIAHSRQTLIHALDAFEQAFVASDMAIARGHLEEVEVASSVAERLLRPRGTSLSSTQEDISS